MKKSYKLEILDNGKSIDGFHQGYINISIDPDDYNDMLLLVSSLTSMLVEAEVKLNSQGKDSLGLTLRVFSNDGVLFESITALDSYKMNRKIKSWFDSSMSTYITVNGIRYHGELIEGMIPEETKLNPLKVKEEIKLSKGSIITTIRDKYNTVHQYMLVKDGNKDPRPYRLISLTGGYTILVGFSSLKAIDALRFIENMGMRIVGIEDPRKSHHLYK